MAPKRSLPFIKSPSPRPEDEPESEEISEDKEEEQEVAEQGDGGDGSQEEEESEGEDEQNQVHPVTTPSVKKKPSSSEKKAPLSDSGSDSESDSGTDSDQARAKPLEPKSRVDSKNLKPSKLAGSKRPVEAEPSDSVSKGLKKSKKLKEEEKMKKKKLDEGDRKKNKKFDEEDKKKKYDEEGKKKKKKFDEEDKKKKMKKFDEEDKKKKEISKSSTHEERTKEENNEISKRRIHEDEKIMVVSKAVVGDDEKKSPFQKIWKDEDEIVLLNGLIEFQSKKGIKSTDDATAFHDFVKESLSVSMSKSQVSEKIRRMKKKFLVNAERKDPVFSKPHENQVFELSKKIWGAEGSVKGKEPSSQDSLAELEKEAPKAKEKKKAKQAHIQEANVVEKNHSMPDTVSDEVDPDGFWSHYPLLKQSQSLIPDGCRGSVAVKAVKCLGRTKVKEMEDEWNKFNLKDWKLCATKINLIKEHNSLMLGALESLK